MNSDIKLKAKSPSPGPISTIDIVVVLIEFLSISKTQSAICFANNSQNSGPRDGEVTKSPFFPIFSFPEA